MTENKPVATAEPALAGVNFAALLGDPAANGVAATSLEKAIEAVPVEDAIGEVAPDSAFAFRSLLTEEQRAQLEASAPAVAKQMLRDYNAIIAFGAPVLEKFNATSVQMLEAQKNIKVPAADVIVNDLMREMDGFEKKYRNAKMEDAIDKIKKFFRSSAYTFKTMVRESKPIEDKLDMVTEQLRQMELDLADNVTRGHVLHKATLDTLEEVVAVLAALEEIQEAARVEFKVVDALLIEAQAEADAQGLSVVTYDGEELSLNELKDLHAGMAQGLGELEKTFVDWRSQFFIGFAQAPTIRNLILVSATMQRRCQVFRTMGVPAARRSLVIWQQAVLAKEGAEMGEAVQEGVNKLLQDSMGAAADAVVDVAMASQAPVVTEDTIFAVIDSVKKQCEGLVAADKWGRELRAKNIAAMEAGEKAVDAAYVDSRRQLAKAALEGAEAPAEAAPAPDADILKGLGIK